MVKHRTETPAYKKSLCLALISALLFILVFAAFAREYYLTGDCRKDCMGASYLACLDDCGKCSGSGCDYDKCEEACKKQTELCLAGCR